MYPPCICHEFLVLAFAKILVFSVVFLKVTKSMFCNYEKISCEILNTAIGPDHAKIAIAELKLTLRKYGKGIIHTKWTILYDMVHDLDRPNPARTNNKIFFRILCEGTSQNKETS